MKRLLSIFLALTLLLSAMMFTSCGSDIESEDSVSTELSDKELTEADILGFEQQDYQDKEFTILLNNAYTFNERDFWVSDSTANGLSRAIYERNRMCEDYLGIKINIDAKAGAHGSTVTEELDRIVKGGGECPWDMVAIGMGMIVQGGKIDIYKNIMKMDYIDLDHDWWVDGLVDQLSINNQLYLIAGDVCQSTYTYIGATYANLAVAETFHIDIDFYELVKSGDWTLDEFFRLYKLVGEDSNGDGKYDSETETYGWCNHGIGARLMWTAAGIEMIQRQSDGTFALRSSLDSRIIDLVDKFMTAFEDPHSEYVGDDEQMAKAFAEDRVLFVTSYLGQAENFRKSNMESPFAILPMPKYDDSQEDYIASNSGTYNALCFPVTAASDELCAQVAEYMGYYGQKYVIPQYYDVALKYKQNDVAANIEMIDLLRDKLIITPNESYGSIQAQGVSQIMYFTQLTYYTTGKKGDGSKAFYANPSSVWQTVSGPISGAIRNYVLQYYG